MQNMLILNIVRTGPVDSTRNRSLAQSNRFCLKLFFFYIKNSKQHIFGYKKILNLDIMLD